MGSISTLESPEDAIEIFVSYACNDNVVRPGATNAKGFVSTLVQYLDYRFILQGPPKIKLCGTSSNSTR